MVTKTVTGQQLDIRYDLSGYTPHEHQRLFHASRARYRVLACGRRWGKDRACIYEMLRLLPKMLEENAGLGLVPTVLVWCVAPTYPIGEQLWAELKNFIAQVNQSFIVEIREGDRCLRCLGGIEIWIKTASDPEHLVGVGLDLLVITEAALIDEDAWTTGLRPMLSSPGRHGLALFNSTPKGLGWFQKLYLRGQDSLQSREVESWNYPTWDNPYVDKEEVARAKAELPQSVFDQEYGAQFLSEVGLVFHHVDGCIQGVLEDAREGHQYIGGIDLAKHHDFTVVAIADKATRRVVFWDRFSHLDYAVQKGRISQAFGRYNRARGWLDSTGVGDPILEDLQRMGVQVEGYHFTTQAKRQLIDGLAIALEQERIRFPAIPALVNELKAYQYETTTAGNIRTNAPGGGYDDCVIALALVNYGLGIFRESGSRKPGRLAMEGAGDQHIGVR